MNFLRSVNGGGYVGASDEILFWEAARYYSLFPFCDGSPLGALRAFAFSCCSEQSMVRAWEDFSQGGSHTVVNG